jgi:hypothetical protein
VDIESYIEEYGMSCFVKVIMEYDQMIDRFALEEILGLGVVNQQKIFNQKECYAAERYLTKYVYDTTYLITPFLSERPQMATFICKILLCGRAYNSFGMLFSKLVNLYTTDQRELSLLLFYVFHFIEFDREACKQILITAKQKILNLFLDTPYEHYQHRSSQFLLPNILLLLETADYARFNIIMYFKNSVFMRGSIYRCLLDGWNSRILELLKTIYVFRNHGIAAIVSSGATIAVIKTAFVEAKLSIAEVMDGLRFTKIHITCPTIGATIRQLVDSYGLSIDSLNN